MSIVRLFLVKKLLRRIKSRAQYDNIEYARRGFEKVVSKFNRPLSGFTYTPANIAGIKSEWIMPDGADDKKLLLYFHGGGYATGSLNTHRALVSQIVKHAGIKALSIEYRLAPEHKYPAPIEDAVAVYQWLLQNGYSASQIAFGGDSAGGGVTFGTLLYLKHNNIPLPNCAIGLSPWVDQSLSGDSIKTKHDEDPMLVAAAFPLWSKNYMGDADPKAPYASPIFHDLTGMPPVYIQVGEDEMLLDDSTRYFNRAKADGVMVEMDVYPKKFHVFNAFWRILPKAREANKKLGLFLKQQLNAAA